MCRFVLLPLPRTARIISRAFCIRLLQRGLPGLDPTQKGDRRQRHIVVGGSWLLGTPLPFGSSGPLSGAGHGAVDRNRHRHQRDALVLGPKRVETL